MISEAHQPYSEEVLEEIRRFFQKALAADDNEYSQAVCQTSIAYIDGYLAFNAGKWVEETFDPKLLGWFIPDGIWSTENEHSAVGHARRPTSDVCVGPNLIPPGPLEIEFSVEIPPSAIHSYNLGLFIPFGDQTGIEKKTFHQFFICLRDNEAGIEIGGKPADKVPSH